jgi:hypothetical protein
VLVLNVYVPPLELYYSATVKKKGIIKGRKEYNTGKVPANSKRLLALPEQSPRPLLLKF